MNLTKLVRLYPRVWRERYGEEFAALLADCAVTPGTALDVLCSALDAHWMEINRQWRMTSMFSRPRNSALTVFCAWVAYVLAGLCFYGVLDDNPLTALARSQGGGLRFSVWAVQAGAVLALLAVLAGALPIGWAILTSALRQRSRDVLTLLAVPPLSLIVVLAYVGYLLVLGNQPGLTSAAPDAHMRTLVYVFQFVFMGLAIASTTALVAAVQRSQLDERPYRATRLPAVLASASMGLTLLGLLSWGASA
jgi:hypothetical protein